MSEISKLQADALSDILSKHLSRTPGGRQVLDQLLRHETGAPAALADYLRTELRSDAAFAEQVDAVLGRHGGEITNVISESQIDQIINVAKLDALNLTQYREFILFRDLKQLVTFLVIVIGTIGLVSAGLGYTTWKNAQPDLMDGDFNIAIARFAEITDRGPEATKETLAFMQALCNFLDTEYNAEDFGLDVQISHRKMPVVTESLQAEQLAEKTNSNLVIYGFVDLRGSEGEFTPNFYVVDHPGTREISGYNELHTPIHFEKGLANEAELKSVLMRRAETLVNFTTGLVYLAEENMPGADDSFRKAIRAGEAIGPFGGQEVLYLMLAYTQRRQGHYTEALKTLDSSLALNPEYARAHIGRANNYYELYRQAHDIELLQQAEDAYHAAQRAGDRPPGAYIEEKSDIGLGNVLFERARVTGDLALLDEIIPLYESVIRRYEVGQEVTLGRLAGYAYYNLGQIYSLRGDAVAAQTAFAAVLDLPTDRALQEQTKQRLAAFD